MLPTHFGDPLRYSPQRHAANRKLRRQLAALISDGAVVEAAQDGPVDAFDLADRWGVPAEWAAARVILFLTQHDAWHARMGPG